MNWNDPPPEIERLRDQLDRAQRVVLGLMPVKAQETLNPYNHDNLHDLDEWDRFVVPRIIELAQPIGNTERAFCPLCGDGPQQGYRDGFKLPEGLTRHLNGSHQFHRCGVMAVVWEFARAYFKRKAERKP